MLSIFWWKPSETDEKVCCTSASATRHNCIAHKRKTDATANLVQEVTGMAAFHTVLWEYKSGKSSAVKNGLFAHRHRLRLETRKLP